MITCMRLLSRRGNRICARLERDSIDQYLSVKISWESARIRENPGLSKYIDK